MRALLLLAALLAAVLAAALTSLHRWGEWHHGYLGAMLVAAGVALDLLGFPRAGLGVAAAGLILLADDAQAHARQALDPAFPRSGVRGHRDATLSPLHRLAHRLGLI